MQRGVCLHVPKGTIDYNKHFSWTTGSHLKSSLHGDQRSHIQLPLPGRINIKSYSSFKPFGSIPTKVDKLPARLGIGKSLQHMGQNLGGFWGINGAQRHDKQKEEGASFLIHLLAEKKGTVAMLGQENHTVAMLRPWVENCGQHGF